MDSNITIMTPTYNRAYILGNLYASLKKQTSVFKEWLIVDDGSTDNTKELVEKWQKECNRFPIIYVYQDNGGKHRALNKGVHFANGKYIFVVDSDDTLTPNAIEISEQYIGMIDREEKFAGVCGLRGHTPDVSMVKYPKKAPYFDGTGKEICRIGMTGDKAEIVRTDLLKKYPFPEFEGENFLTEGAFWLRLSQEGYKLRVFPRIIYLCRYREDGLTRNLGSLIVNNWNGFTYNTKLGLEELPFRFRWRTISKYVAYAKKKKYGYKYVHNTLSVGYFEIFIGDIIQKMYFVFFQLRMLHSKEVHL